METDVVEDGVVDEEVAGDGGEVSLGQAVEAMKRGAPDFLEKPADIDTLVSRIETAATEKTKLDDQRIEQRLSDIVRKKGW